MYCVTGWDQIATASSAFGFSFGTLKPTSLCSRESMRRRHGTFCWMWHATLWLRAQQLPVCSAAHMTDRQPTMSGWTRRPPASAEPRPQASSPDARRRASHLHGTLWPSVAHRTAGQCFVGTAAPGRCDQMRGDAADGGVCGLGLATGFCFDTLSGRGGSPPLGLARMFGCHCAVHSIRHARRCRYLEGLSAE